MASDVDQAVAKAVATERAKIGLVVQLAIESGVRPTAGPDFAQRALATFAEEYLDMTAGRQWVQRIRPNAGHLFESPAAQGPAGARGASPAPSATEPIVLTDEEKALPPTERMTIAREREAQQAAVKVAGGQR